MLENHLQKLIKLNGPLSVADFMNEALFNPLYGYYQKNQAIGKDADFITAPEISQVFGEIIAIYLLNFFISKNPDLSKESSKICLVEMGAGRGTLMNDILFCLKKLSDQNIAAANHFLKSICFNIIEISPCLQKLQQEKLKEVILKTGVKINWYKDFFEFQKINQGQELYFIANELFDCFAINQFVKDDSNKWHEIKISLASNDKDKKLQFFKSNFNPAAHQLVEKLLKDETIDDQIIIKSGSVFEYSFAAANFMQELSLYLKNNHGLALIFDYGYIKNKLVNTLQAVKNHQKTNILKSIGDTDLTALVNFTLLKKIAKNNNLNSSLITQREFLISLGIESRRKSLLENKNDLKKAEINSAINRLIDEEQMGELFKCLILWN
jgi:NADH dehydrogenase [ubiquinone] 1 alpha subcomplex assembly factor 7